MISAISLELDARDRSRNAKLGDSFSDLNLDQDVHQLLPGGVVAAIRRASQAVGICQLLEPAIEGGRRLSGKGGLLFYVESAWKRVRGRAWVFALLGFRLVTRGKAYIAIDHGNHSCPRGTLGFRRKGILNHFITRTYLNDNVEAPMASPVYALNLFNVADRDEYLAYPRRSAKEVQAHGGRVA